MTDSIMDKIRELAHSVQPGEELPDDAFRWEYVAGHWCIVHPASATCVHIGGGMRRPK